MRTAHQWFEENISKWHNAIDQDYRLVAEAENPLLKIVEAKEGLPNIVETQEGTTRFYHQPEDPIGEAKEWRKTLDLRNIHILFVYGVGMGYAYEGLEEWLHSDKKNCLVFLETDPAVLKLLFSTARGEKLLRDSQVWLYLLGSFREEFLKFNEITSLFAGGAFKISALNYYLIHRAAKLMELNTVVSFGMNMKMAIQTEYSGVGAGFFLNFYRNIFSLPEAYVGHKLYGRFKGIPAIICGAGPSLQKNISLLATLKDRALIFGGGTAMNVLNAAGINPHFGVGIDPNSEQVMRLMSNTAFQVPYFYRTRMNFSALHFVHGDKLLISGSPSYPIVGWLEEQLGIAGPAVDEGHNVINFSLAIAHAMGCHPIITVGVDLAYTDESSYSPLTDRHPLNFGKLKHRTKDSSEELLVRKNIYGQPVFTLWKWMLESVWYSKFALENINLELINATEGGLGFPGVPNKTLAEVGEELLKECYDFEALIHTETQRAAMPPSVNGEAVVALIEQIDKSLRDSAEECRGLQEEFKAIALDISKGREVPEKLVTQKVMKGLLSLDGEVAYSKILLLFNEHCFSGFNRELDRLDKELFFIDPAEINLRRAELNFYRYQFLQSAAERNALMLRAGFCAYQEKKELLADSGRPEAPSNPYGEGSCYSFEGESFSLVDPELGLNHREAFKSAVNAGDEEYEYYLKNGLLHGPSRGFGPEGQLLYEGWFLEGRREGKAVSYYLSGALYGIGSYRRGKKEGLQRYYYPDGVLRCLVSYKEGLLDGKVVEYYPNGEVKREVSFSAGKKEGAEELFSYNGQKLVEAHYQQGHAVGEALYHNGSGQLLRRVRYDSPGHISSVEAWDSEGNLIESVESEGGDYFDNVALLSQKLTSSLQEVCQQVEAVAPILIGGGEKTFVEEIKKDLDAVKEQIVLLEKLSGIMYDEAGLGLNNTHEPIWKTPSLQQNIDDRLQLVVKEVGSALLSVQTALGEMLDTLFNKKGG